MSLIRRLGKETLIYGFGKAIGSAIAILFVPVYTRMLGTEGFGFVDTISTAVALVSVVAVCGLDSAVGFYYFDAKDETSKKLVLFNGLAFRIAASVLLSALSLPLVLLIVPPGNASFSSVMTFSVLAFARLPFQLVQAYCRDAFRLENKIWHFFWTTLFYSLISVAFPVLFVIVLERGVQGVFEAALGVEILASIVCFVVSHGRLLYRLDGPLIRRMLIYGLPILPTSLMFYLIQSFDRPFIVAKLGISAVGIYSIAYKVVGVLLFAISSYQMAWGIFGFSIKDDPQARNTYSRVMTYYALGFGWLTMAVSLFGFEALVLLSTPEFYPAANVIGWLCVAQWINGMYNQVSIGSVIAKRTINIPISGACGCAVSLAANSLLIGPFGLPGAACASLLGYGTSVLVMLVLSQRAFRVNYQRLPVVTALLFALGLVVASLCMPRLVTPGLVMIKSLILGLVGIVFYFLARRYGSLDHVAATNTVLDATGAHDVKGGAIQG